MEDIHITTDLKLIIDHEEIDFKTDKGLKYKNNIKEFRKRVKESFDCSDDVYCHLNIKEILSKEDFLRDFFVDVLHYYSEYDNIFSVKDSEVHLDIYKSLSTYKEKIKYVRYFHQVLIDLFISCDEVIEEVSESYMCKQFNLYTKKWINEMLKDEYIKYLKDFNSIIIKNKELIKCKKKSTQRAYILKDNNTGYYKIGKSVNPKDRERTLQSEKPTIKMIKEFKTDIEKELHQKYFKQRIRGEWFNLNEIQLKYICTTYK